MPLRFVARYLANHPEVIDKLANSYPVRRAAQLGASLFFRGQSLGAERFPKIPIISKYLENQGTDRPMDRQAEHRFWYGENSNQPGNQPSQTAARKTVPSRRSTDDGRLRRMKEAVDDMHRKQIK